MNRLAFHLVAALSLALVVEARADDQPKLKGSKKEVPKIDLGLPAFEKTPSTSELKAPTTTSEPTGPKSVDVTYTLVHVLSAKSFIRTPKGAKPAATMEAVIGSGNPPLTDKFTTIARIKSSDKGPVGVTVTIRMPNGSEFMSASGVIRFTKPDEELEWAVDWDPSPFPGAGSYQVDVRVGERDVGSAPLVFALKK